MFNSIIIINKCVGTDVIVKISTPSSTSIIDLILQKTVVKANWFISGLKSGVVSKLPTSKPQEEHNSTHTVSHLAETAFNDIFGITKSLLYSGSHYKFY